MRIRSKINISFLITFIVLASIIATVTGLYTTYLVKNETYSYLYSSSRARAEHVRTFIQSQQKTAVILAAASVYLDFLQEPVNSQQYPIIKEKVIKRLERTLEADPNLIEIDIIGLDGKIIVSSDPKEEGGDEFNDDYFIEGLKGTFIKDVYYLDNEVLSYAISTPIKDSDGGVLGVSLLRYKPDLFYSIVENENGLGNTEDNFLINKDKFLITPSRFLSRDYIFKQKNDTKNANDCYDPLEIEYVKKNGYSGLVENFDSQSLEYLDYRNIMVIGTHAYIPETDWCLITKVDRADVLGFRIILTIINIIILLISVLIFFLVGYWVSKKITKPIKDLLLGTDKIKEGDYDYRITVDAKDELGVLAEAFNTMTDDVKNSRSEIEQKVLAQTADIKNKVKDLDDQKTAIMNILEDVEKEKNKFEQVSNKLSLATKSAHIGIWEWDVVKNIITLSEEMYKIYGLKKEDFGGAYEAWQAGLHPDDKKAGDEAIQKALKGEKDFTLVFRVIWPNGEIRYVQAYALVERDSDGKPLKMIGVNFDITREKEVDKAKTEFVSLASHQLRTPLSAVNWYTEMLLTEDVGKINKKQKEYLQEIYIGNNRMIELVNALLNVSRLDLGTFSITLEKMDVPQLIKSLLAELQPEINKRNEVVIEKYSEKIPLFLADKNSLRMVLQNILSNAVKYTSEKGNITVEVIAGAKGENIEGKKIKKESLIIKVADSGIGIPKDQQSKIFSKLFRADNARQRETEGTGLGLYIVKSIINQSGGDIWFNSEENKGTTFVISYPLTGMINIPEKIKGDNLNS